jgi:hypothetical protein
MEPSSCPLASDGDTHASYIEADAELRAAGYRYSFECSHWCHPTRAPAHIRRVRATGSRSRQVTRYVIVYAAAG